MNCSDMAPTFFSRRFFPDAYFSGANHQNANVGASHSFRCSDNSGPVRAGCRSAAMGATGPPSELIRSRSVGRRRGANLAPKAILVHNASAGTREPSLEDLTAMIEAAGYRVKYRNSKAPDLEAKLDKQGDLVVAAGGDGTIAKVAKILLSKPEQGAPLAILPIGTANNIALSLGIAEPPEALIPRWNATPLRKLSHGVAHAHWGEQRFIEGVGLGSLAEATTPKPKESKDRSVKGRARRITDGRIAFRKAIKHAKPERLYVTVDGTRIEDEVVL